ncbi:MAG: ATP phosphoribosyltransferase [Planctomycetales bacterium]|nr:ATP phosphoribosyltransferase [Planctomycetales bacterium]
MTPFRIGIPSKGRLSELAEQLLSDAGLSFRRQNRSLFAKVKELPVDVTFLRTEDIPVLCAEGAIDMGITGSDLLAEAEVDLKLRLPLGVGRCRLSVCVPDEGPIQAIKDLHGKRIATSFPNVTRQFLSEHGIEAHLVLLTGSVEVMIALGVADAIVDLVETGSTLAANRLKVLTDIGQYETVLVQNDHTESTELCDRIVKRIEGVVIARAFSLLEYNVPRDRLAEAEALTPGFNSPTVNPLEDATLCAVRAMVRKNDVIDVMEKLDQLGATAILETKISNCRL